MLDGEKVKVKLKIVERADPFSSNWTYQCHLILYSEECNPQTDLKKFASLVGFPWKQEAQALGTSEFNSEFLLLTLPVSLSLSVSLSSLSLALSLSLSLSLIKVLQRKFLLNPKQYRCSLERNLQSCLAPVNIYFNIYCTYNFSDKWVKLFLHLRNLASRGLFSSKIFSRINHDRYKFCSEHFAYVFFPLINSTSPFNRFKNKSWKSVDASQQTQN